MNSRPPTNITDMLMEAQDNYIFKDTTEVSKAPATKVIKASTTKVIKASTTEVIKASTTKVIKAPAAKIIKAPAANTIKALAKGITAPATITTLAKSTTISIIPITITEPELLAYIMLVYKIIPKISIYIIFNGKTFN
jgi:rRNA processing protein Krr1/Pno1